jgi:metacaspase-1
MKFALLCVVLLGLTIQVVPALAENRALIIGIGSGYNSQNKLPGPEPDVKMAQYISQQIGIPANKTKIIVNEQATHDGIVNGFRWVQEGVRDGGKAFIYYSGHGYQIEDKGGDADDEGCDEVLVPVDMKWVVDKEIKQLLKGMDKAEVILMADSCFSGTIHKGLHKGGQAKVFKSNAPAPVCAQPTNTKGVKHHRSLGVDAETVKASEKLIVLSATTKHELAQASDRGSFFTLSVYETLKSKGVKTSFREVMDVARDQVRDRSEQVNVPKHTPQLDGNPDYFDWSFDFSGAVGTGSAVAPQTVESTNNNQEMFNWLVNNSQFAVSIEADKKAIKLEEKIGLELYSSRNGYVNILDCGPDGEITVLFPNQYKSNNAIQAEKRLKIPEDIGGFRVTGKLLGKSQTLVLVTSEPLNLYTEGGEKVTKFKSFKKNDFYSLKKLVTKGVAKATRSLGVEKDVPGGSPEYGANAVTITVTK